MGTKTMMGTRTNGLNATAATLRPLAWADESGASAPMALREMPWPSLACVRATSMASRADPGSRREYATSSQPSTTVRAFDTSWRAPAKSASWSGGGGGRLLGALERGTGDRVLWQAICRHSIPEGGERAPPICGTRSAEIGWD